MIVSADSILNDMICYVEYEGYSFSDELFIIISKVEHLCYTHNVCPFLEEYLLVLIEEVPLFQKIIKKYGGSPELAIPLLYEEFKKRDGIKEASEYKSSSVYSSRSIILDIAIDYANQKKRKEIIVTDLIKAILKHHDETWPVWENGNWSDDRFSTKFNTLSHVASFYCEYLWVKIDDIFKELEGYEIYDIAISFAGEDRKVAKDIACLMTAQGFRVFYDEYERAELWGKDLYLHLTEIYSKKARFCLMIVSKYYERKQWTTLERKSAQAKAFQENVEYILPLRLDDTEIPGLLPTIGYVDFRQFTLSEVVELLKRKLLSDQHGA